MRFCCSHVSGPELGVDWNDTQYYVLALLRLALHTACHTRGWGGYGNITATYRCLSGVPLRVYVRTLVMPTTGTGRSTAAWPLSASSSSSSSVGLLAANVRSQRYERGGGASVPLLY